MMRGAVTALRRRADRQVKIAAGGTGEAAIAARIAESCWRTRWHARQLGTYLASFDADRLTCATL